MIITFQPQPFKKLNATLTMYRLYIAIIVIGLTALNCTIASWLSENYFGWIVFACFIVEAILWIWYEIKHAYRDDEYDEREELWKQHYEPIDTDEDIVSNEYEIDKEDEVNYMWGEDKYGA